MSEDRDCERCGYSVAADEAALSRMALSFLRSDQVATLGVRIFGKGGTLPTSLHSDCLVRAMAKVKGTR